MRERKTGTVVWMGSLAGYESVSIVSANATYSRCYRRGWPNIGLYCATKAVNRSEPNSYRTTEYTEGPPSVVLAETLHAEISHLGLRSIAFEPGYFRASFLTADNLGGYPSRIADYKELTDEANARFAGAYMDSIAYDAVGVE